MSRLGIYELIFTDIIETCKIQESICTCMWYTITVICSLEDSGLCPMDRLVTQIQVRMNINHCLNSMSKNSLIIF